MAPGRPADAEAVADAADDGDGRRQRFEGSGSETTRLDRARAGGRRRRGELGAGPVPGGAGRGRKRRIESIARVVGFDGVGYRMADALETPFPELPPVPSPSPEPTPKVLIYSLHLAVLFHDFVTFVFALTAMVSGLSDEYKNVKNLKD